MDDFRFQRRLRVLVFLKIGRISSRAYLDYVSGIRRILRVVRDPYDNNFQLRFSLILFNPILRVSLGVNYQPIMFSPNIV
jgi:hypothetical protein